MHFGQSLPQYTGYGIFHNHQWCPFQQGSDRRLRSLTSRAPADQKKKTYCSSCGCLGECTILSYCSRTFWVYIAPFAFLSKRVVCSLTLLIAVFSTSGEGTCASNPPNVSKNPQKKTCCVECWLFLLWWAWQP